MATSLKAWWAVERVVDGAPEPGANLSLIDPVKPVTITGDRWHNGTVFSVPANTTLTLWDVTTTTSLPQIEFLAFQIDPVVGGVLHPEFFTDTPTSASVLTPSGANPVWRNHPMLSCHAPLIFTSATVLVSSTTHYLYKVRMKNPSTTTAVLVRMYGAN